MVDLFFGCGDGKCVGRYVMGGRGHTSPCGWSVTGVGSTLVHYSSVSTLLVGVRRYCWLVYDNYCWHADK